MKVSESIQKRIRRYLPFLSMVMLAGCGIYETKNQNQSTLQAPNGLTLSQITPNTKLSYATIRALVIEANCKKCHIDQSRAGVSLTDYASTKANLAGIEATVFNGGSDPMPPAPAVMPNLAKAALKQWIDQGAPEFSKDDPQTGPPSPTATVTPTATPEPILVVSYAQVSAQVFSVSCKKCHMDGAAKGKVALDTYAEVIANLPAIESTVFKGVPKLMPRSGLPANQKLLLQTWIDLGAKEGVVVVATPTPTATPLPTAAPAPAPQAELMPTFASIKSVVFESKCLKCHAAGARAEDLPLDNYTNMLAAEGFVLPGNLAGSSLIKAIESGSMPPKRANLPAVTPEELAVIKNWITNGAPQ